MLYNFWSGDCLPAPLLSLPCAWCDGQPACMICCSYSYLSSRMQRVCLQGSSSSWGLVHAGMPQGSILGLLLFSIYVNDLPAAVVHRCQLNMYVDDMEIHCNNADLSAAQCDWYGMIWILYSYGYTDQSIESKCGKVSCDVNWFLTEIVGSWIVYYCSVGSTQLSQVVSLIEFIPRHGNSRLKNIPKDTVQGSLSLLSDGLMGKL